MSDTKNQTMPLQESEKTQTKDSDTTETTPETAQVIEYTKEKVEAMLAKARQDEKNKTYSRLEMLNAEKTEQEKKAAELSAKLQDMQKALDNMRSGASTELDSVTKELQTMRAHNESLSKQIEDVAAQAELRVRNSELAAYKEKAIRTSNVELIELVTGNSEEEIDASIKKVLEREASLRARLKEDARKELAANLPSPLSPDGTQGRDQMSSTFDYKQRTDMARLNRVDFQKAKSDALMRAKKKAGWI